MSEEKLKSEQQQMAIIYCRVSSKKQREEGSGLDSQEHRCREYAEEKGYQVAAMFPDDVSGGGDFMNRPGMVALLAFLDASPHENYVVIFDDLKRYARDTEFHLKLKREMLARNARRECLNFRFEDTPEGKFIETVFAAQGELEREQNGRQVRQKMQARMEQGFWVFHAPVGYCYASAKHGGKELVRHESLASIIQEAFEGYACGRFDSQVEVKRYFESQPEFPRGPSGIVKQQRVTEILTHPIYAGYISHKNWNISWAQGRHEPLISLETFEKVQERRRGCVKAPARKNLSLDFPLRGFVLCHDCNKPLTACWSTGKRKKYPYYLCDTKGCVSYRKSIRRDKIEGEFDEIVRSLQPSKGLFEIAKAMFRDAWDQRAVQAENLVETLKLDMKLIEKQLEDVLERIMSASNTTVITAYETKIEKLERNKRILAEKLAKGPVTQGKFDQFIEHAMVFLANPWNLWRSGSFTLKQTVLRLAFSERIAYCRKEGYRTPKTALPFKVLGDISIGKSQMVRPRRLELPRVLSHSDLNAARLPVPPRPHTPDHLTGSRRCTKSFAARQAQKRGTAAID